MQPCLNERVIKHRVLFASGHKGEASQICQDSPGAILAIEPEQGSFLRKLVCRQKPANGSFALTQFLPVAPVAPVAKRAEPLETVGLTDDGARPDDFPALASRLASSTDLIQPAIGRWQLFCLRQGALAGGFTRAIDIEDHPSATLSIYQAACLPLL